MTDIALGSHVTFTHRAAVGRRQPHWTYEGAGLDRTRKREWHQWELTEPKANITASGDKLTLMTHVTPVTFVELAELVELDTNGRRRYPVSEERWEQRNKTIFQWPQEGSGVVVGQVSKQYGISHPSAGEDDVGYFESFGQVSLYVVKSELRGPQIYVPQAAIHLVHGSPS
jgi:hypothetical protein